MGTKQVTDREKASRAVITAAEGHEAEAVDALTAVLAPDLAAGETMPDWGLVVRLVHRRIARFSAGLVATMVVHETELADDAAPRAARDAAAEELRTILIDLRGGVDAAFGPRGLSVLQLATPPSPDPSALAVQVQRVIAALTDDTVALPAARRSGLTVDRVAFARDLGRQLPILRTALTDVAREVHEAQLTLAAKDAAQAANDEAFARGAQFLTALLELAGLDALAARVKPARRRGVLANAPAETPSVPADPASDGTK